MRRETTVWGVTILFQILYRVTFSSFSLFLLLKSELRKQQYNVTLFDCNQFGTRNSSLANATIYVLLYTQFFLCFILNLRAISKYKPPGACTWRGDLLDSLLRYEFAGLIQGEAYFLNFTVFGIQTLETFQDL